MIELLTFIITFIIIIYLAALGGSISERSGIINLATEGFMTLGAITYALLAGREGSAAQDANLNQFWYIAVAMVVTMLIGLIYGALVISLKANQTIAGIALNLLAIGIALYVVHSDINPNGGAGTMIELQKTSWSIAGTGNISSPLSMVNTSVLIGIPVILILITVLNKTKLGIKIKTCGEQPHAAASLGIPVKKIQLASIAISAATGAIAGAILVQFKTPQFGGTTQGIGFLAVAIVIFGQWRPSIILLGSIIFGGLTGLVYNTALVPALSTIDSDLAQILPFGLSLLVLVFTQRFSKAPKYLGIPYENVGR